VRGRRHRQVWLHGHTFPLFAGAVVATHPSPCVADSCDTVEMPPTAPCMAASRRRATSAAIFQTLSGGAIVLEGSSGLDAVLNCAPGSRSIRLETASVGEAEAEVSVSDFRAFVRHVPNVAGKRKCLAGIDKTNGSPP
jgi:hypothetical protein